MTMTSTVSAEVTVNEQLCKGCRLCVLACPRQCLQINEDKFNAQGYRPSAFTHPERCNTCGYCARLCPDGAIEVFLVVG